MPVFRIPRAHFEVEVSHLEAQGYRPAHFTPDGDHVIAYCPPLWHERPASVTLKGNAVEIRPLREGVLERTELGQFA